MLNGPCSVSYALHLLEVDVRSMDSDRLGVAMMIVEVRLLLVYYKHSNVGYWVTKRVTRDLCVRDLLMLQTELVDAAHALSLFEITMSCVVMTPFAKETSSGNVNLSCLARGPPNGLYEMQGREGLAQ